MRLYYCAVFAKLGVLQDLFAIIIVKFLAKIALQTNQGLINLELHPIFGENTPDRVNLDAFGA